MLVSGLSLPIVWGLLQVYQHWIISPLGEAVLALFPHIFEHIYVPPQQTLLLASSLLSLLIFGICGLIWPEVGFGQSWQPSRKQSIVVLGIIVISVAYPILNSFIDYATPVKQMGFIVWTITPVQEEILFRGFLYSFALHLFGRTQDSSWDETFPVLVVGALWFSLWHLSPPAIQRYGWGLIGPQAILTFGAGLLFNGLRYWTRSIWLIIPVHAVGNFMISIM